MSNRLTVVKRFSRAMRRSAANPERVIPLRGGVVLAVISILTLWLFAQSADRDVQPLTASAANLLMLVPLAAMIALGLAVATGRSPLPYLGVAIMAAAVAGGLNNHGTMVDDFADWAVANPKEAIGLAFGLVLGAWAWMAGPWLVPAGVDQRDFENEAWQGLRRHSAIPEQRLHRGPLTKEERSATAVHEAGHLLPFAMLAQLPRNLTAHINDPPGTGFHGHVSHDPCEAEPTRDFLRWRMLVMLAGNVAGDVVLGRNDDGGTTDYATWMAIARKYLAAGFEGPYFNNATDDAEVAINRAGLLELRDQQKRDLADFVRANVELLAEISAELQRQGMLDSVTLERHLARVAFTPAISPLHIGFVANDSGRLRVESMVNGGDSDA